MASASGHRARAGRLIATALALALVGQGSSEAHWRPRPTTNPWQLQLSGKVDTSVRAPVYDVDGVETSGRAIRRLRRRRRRVICYSSAGAYESCRSDASRFPREGLGRPLADFPDERWLDIRR